MICSHCQYSWSEVDTRFCPNCGKPLHSAVEANTRHSKHNVFFDVANRINQVAGMETPQELRLGEVFSQVFAKHTEEEAERLFVVGTSRVQVALTIVGWIIAFAVIGTGLKQISSLKQKNHAAALQSEGMVAPTSES